MNELKKNYELLSKQMSELREKMKELSKPYLEELFQKAFDENPEITEFFWTQYTPYFNDGDACEFSVHDVYFILDKDKDACSYEGTYISSYKPEEYNKHLYEIYSRRRVAELKNVLDIVNESIHSIRDDIMQMLFGDHVKITVNRNSEGKAVIDIDEYDHD
jgi:5'-deoxynucleotidase YfbR-like HD superfamily hydrolase